MLRLDDYGSAVTLDLHGATVREAEELALALVQEAARRGRSSVKLIHGSSTSDPRHANRTIKHALYDMLESEAFPSAVTSHLRAEDYLVLSLDVTAQADPTPIRLYDL